jgi:hypothetical protein
MRLVHARRVAVDSEEISVAFSGTDFDHSLRCDVSPSGLFLEFEKLELGAPNLGVN